MHILKTLILFYGQKLHYNYIDFTDSFDNHPANMKTTPKNFS